jgi:uncharacterized protein
MHAPMPLPLHLPLHLPLTSPMTLPIATPAPVPETSPWPVHRVAGARFSQRCFSLQALPREPWKNQGGWTRTVASAQGADGQTDWRVSVADITAAGPFSVFEGLDRQAVMLQGTCLRLRAEPPEPSEPDICFNGAGSRAAFAGERRLVCDTPTEPTTLWNVMHRRGHVRAEVSVQSDTVLHLPPARHLFVYVMSGEVELALPQGRTQGLSTGQVLHLQHTPAQALLAPCRVGSWVVVTVMG